MTGGRTLGLSLLVGAGVVLALMVAWLLVSGATAGGVVLGLLLALVIAGPLAGGGVYVLSSQRAEAAATAAFTSRQRIIDADRRFRAEMADQLRGLAERPDSASADLRELAADVQRPTRTGADWGDSIQLDDAQLTTLGRYDDLVRQRVRALRDGSGEPERLVHDLRASLDQRDDLLLRGREPAGLAPSVLLRAEPRRGAEALAQLRVGDAVSREQVDYVVDGSATYFDSGTTWRLFRLTATTGSAPAWVYLAPGGLAVAVVDEVSSLDDQPLQREAQGTAVVDVVSRSGTARGVLVAYERFRGDSRIGQTEHWPDGATHAYVGEVIAVDELDVWPADLQPGNT